MPLPEIPGRLEELCAWLTANGINPKSIPEDTIPSVRTDSDGRRVIDYIVYLPDETDWDNANEVARGSRTAPLVVEPPAWMRA